ncbi:hypothetical protein [Cellulomonas hominis]|uniref:hypothetical protein n=1 Tax=Cellulomonas hominis TaxID=156981 RepID=UPI001B8FE9DB|nr:hypothetical protein [Cellulomonas hominis]VTR78638.1 hypothetical protein CHMI_03421 [Cellulomonas hominis]
MRSYAAALGRAPSGGHDEIDLYVYNMALAGALLGPLHIVEVVTRNAMHELLVARAGRRDWWAEPSVDAVLRGWGKQQLEHAHGKVLRGQARRGRSPTADDVVAATDFGFWTDLTAGAYENTLWQGALRHAFPHSRRSRQQIYQALQSHRRLRNRVSHHEPLHDRDVLEEYRRIIEFIGFVSRPVARWVDDRSRVALIARGKPGASGASPVRYF